MMKHYKAIKIKNMFYIKVWGRILQNIMYEYVTFRFVSAYIKSLKEHYSFFRRKTGWRRLCFLMFNQKNTEFTPKINFKILILNMVCSIKNQHSWVEQILFLFLLFMCMWCTCVLVFMCGCGWLCRPVMAVLGYELDYTWNKLKSKGLSTLVSNFFLN